MRRWRRSQEEKATRAAGRKRKRSRNDQYGTHRQDGDAQTRKMKRKAEVEKYEWGPRHPGGERGGEEDR